MSTKQILVLGGGFAGLWSAAGAARKLDQFASEAGAIGMTRVQRDAFHNIRVRKYEPVRLGDTGWHLDRPIQ